MPMVSNLPQVVSYHPEIKIQFPNGRIATIIASLPDWVPDFEALSTIGNHYGAKTVGELVEYIKRRGGSKFDCKIVDGGDSASVAIDSGEIL